MVTISDSDESDSDEMPLSRLESETSQFEIRSTETEEFTASDFSVSQMDSVISERSNLSGIKAVKKRFMNAKLRKAKMQNGNSAVPEATSGRKERPFARARRMSNTSVAESVTGELQRGLRHLDFSESNSGKRKLPTKNSEAKKVAIAKHKTRSKASQLF